MRYLAPVVAHRSLRRDRAPAHQPDLRIRRPRLDGQRRAGKKQEALHEGGYGRRLRHGRDADRRGRGIDQAARRHAEGAGADSGGRRAMVKRGNRDLKLEFVGQRNLTDSEADTIRATVAAMRPKMHLILPNWRWLECRGLGEQKAAQLIEALDALQGVRFKVSD